MELLRSICEKYNISLCYLFGSQQEAGKARIEGQTTAPSDHESDIDIAVLFKVHPENPIYTYARLSLDLQEIMSPLDVDLVFLHEVDHIIQLYAIQGINIYSENDEIRDDYEHRVMALAADEL